MLRREAWLSFWLLLATCSVLVDSQQSDGEVLLLLKKAITNWNDFSHENLVRGWNDPATVCSWSGITCTPSGRVSQLDLSCAACTVQAIGSLPQELANLTSLEVLELGGHLFTGPLPAAWSTLPSLHSLNLTANQMTSTIPAIWLTKQAFPSLESLLLTGNQLSGTLPVEASFEALLELRLDLNVLSGSLPNSWANYCFPLLTSMQLGSNNLSGQLPEQWGAPTAFPAIEVLDLSSNHLTGVLPNSWGSQMGWQSLQTLQLSNNILVGPLPAQWGLEGALPQLSTLLLDNNTISGPLMESWGNASAFANLTVLNLANNALSSTLPASWSHAGAFASLQNLNLEINHLTGLLPDAWGSPEAFRQLSNLSLIYNKISGPLPDSWGANGSLCELQNLWLSANQLSGSLSSVWGSSTGLESLQDLRLDWNRMTGSIPPSWAGLRQLEDLSLRPGNYYLCGGLPTGATFQLCKLVDQQCSPMDGLGGVCRSSTVGQASAPVPAHTGSLQIVLRIEGLNPLSLPSQLRQALISALGTAVPAANASATELINVAQGAPAPSQQPSLSDAGTMSGRRLLGRLQLSQSLLPDGSRMPARALLQGLEARSTPIDVTLQLVAFPGFNISDLEAQLTTAVAAGELLSLLNDLMVPATSVELVDALPFASAPGPGGATASGAPTSQGRHRQTKAELAVEIVVPVLTLILVVVTGVVLYRHRRLWFWRHREHLDDSPTSELEKGGTHKGADTPAGDGHSGWMLPDVDARSGSSAGKEAHALQQALFRASTPDAGVHGGGSSHSQHLNNPYRSPFEQGPLPGALSRPHHTSPLPPDSQQRLQALLDIPSWQQHHLQGSTFPAASSHQWDRRSSGMSASASTHGGDGPHSGPLPVSREQRQGKENGLQGNMQPSRSMPSLRDADGDAEASAGLPWQVPGSGWDPQVLWDLAQQTSAANNEHAATRSMRAADSPLLARGTGPGRPSPSTPQSPAGGAPPYSSEALLHSIHAAIHKTANASSVGSSQSTAPAASVPPTPPAGSLGESSKHSDSRHGHKGSGGEEVPSSEEHSPLRLPTLPWSDWEVQESDVAVCQRPDGSDWELGGGAFGKVYKAVLGGSSLVAVKVLHETEEAANFGHEIAILRACRHSNIVQFQGACVRGGRVMLVTEFLTGGDLWHALGKPSVSRPIFAWRVWGHKVALDIARGLHFLHSRGPPIVHFDLKSHNILLAADGTAKIADVGLARILNQEYVSKLDDVAGTFAWAAPELLLGRRCSEKVDIFAFGVVLWEIATGERPARGQMREVRVPQELPPKVNELMQQCQDVDPKLRPSAKQIYECLSSACELEQGDS